MADLQEAINILLVARGVTPIIDPDSGHPDVQSSRSLLTRHKRAVSSRKWWFNTEKDIDLAPNPEGYILAPSGVISLDNDQNYTIMRGKLYSMTDRTNVFTEPVLGLTLIYDRDWEDLPIQAFDYITALAKEEFIRPLEAQILSAQAEKDITTALGILQVMDNRFKDVGKQAGNPLMSKWREKMLTR